MSAHDTNVNSCTNGLAAPSFVQNSGQSRSWRDIVANKVDVKPLTRNQTEPDPIVARTDSKDAGSKSIPNQPDYRTNKQKRQSKQPTKATAILNSANSTNPVKNQRNKRPANTNRLLPSTSESRPLQQNRRRARSCKEERKISNVPPVRRYNQPIEISLFDLVNAVEKTQTKKATSEASKPHIDKATVSRGGKTRETPKPKRHTKLKRAILDERAIRKSRRCTSVPASARICAESDGNPDQRATNSTCKVQIETRVHATSTQQSGISPGMSIKKYQNSLVSDLLTKLATFQDRAYSNYANSPFHQKRAKRFVCGLREVTKYLKLNSLKLVIVARDLEGKAVQNLQKRKAGEASQKPDLQAVGDCPSDHSILEDILSKIWDLATQPDNFTPILISHTRRELSFFCHKPSPVSIIGVLNFEGALDIAKKLVGLNSAVNIQFESNDKLSPQPDELSTQDIMIDSPVLMPISEEQEPEFDMVAKLREAIKQLSLRENKPVAVEQ